MLSIKPERLNDFNGVGVSLALILGTFVAKICINAPVNFYRSVCPFISS